MKNNTFSLFVQFVIVTFLFVVVGGCGRSKKSEGTLLVTDTANTEVHTIPEDSNADVGETAVVVEEKVAVSAVSPETVIHGSFIDSRDGKTYRTVTIGEQTWMAENLNFVMDSSWCYDNVDSNCTTYGRVYTWNAAMKACPAGWRLPSKADWEMLINAVEGEEKWTAGTKLKAKTGWYNYVDDEGFLHEGLIIGTDEFGFSALPGGSGIPGIVSIETVGSYGYWWSATEREYNRIYGFNILYDTEDMQWFTTGNSGGLSVRCVKN